MTGSQQGGPLGRRLALIASRVSARRHTVLASVGVDALAALAAVEQVGRRRRGSGDFFNLLGGLSVGGLGPCLWERCELGSVSMMVIAGCAFSLHDDGGGTGDPDVGTAMSS